MVCEYIRARKGGLLELHHFSLSVALKAFHLGIAFALRERAVLVQDGSTSVLGQFVGLSN